MDQEIANDMLTVLAFLRQRPGCYAEQIGIEKPMRTIGVNSEIIGEFV